MINTKIENEEWKPIEGYEGMYEVSNKGKIKSLARDYNNRTLHDRIMKQYVGKTGYFCIRLCKNGKTKLFKVHRLIAEAFIDNPNKLPFINHLDGNKLNNSISNLEWCSPSRNIKHAYLTGLRRTQSVFQLDVEGKVLKMWGSISEASEKTGVDISKICSCCRGGQKTAGGYVWKYAE